MSNCAECFEPVTEKRMETPCCGLVYHASCGIQKLAAAAHENHQVTCECGNVLFECENCFANTHTPETTIEEIMTKPGVPAQVKIVKAKFTAEKKARAAYTKYLREKYTQFAQEVATHKTAIEELKGATLTAIKASEEFKTFRRLRGSAFLAKNKFGTEHSIRGRALRKLFVGSDWGRWYDTPISMFNRRFRIRL
jgi:hypothetical protein